MDINPDLFATFLNMCSSYAITYFMGEKGITFTPFESASETFEGGFHIKEFLEGRCISKVCAVDYVMDFDEWFEEFDKLLKMI